MSRPAVTARTEDGQVLFLGTLPTGVMCPTFPGALCKDASDPELFFPQHGNRAGAEKAKKVCAGCPARVPCLKWALKYERDGIWGGTTPHERERIRRAEREKRSGSKSSSTKAVAA